MTALQGIVVVALTTFWWCSNASADEWTTASPSPLRKSDTPAIAKQACREFANANVPNNAARLAGADPVANGGAAPAPGKVHAGPRAGIRDIPYTISLLCDDPIINQEEIATLYLTLKGRNPNPVAPQASLAAAPELHPSAADALAHLQQAALQFIQMRVDNEIESNLRERVWTTLDNRRILEDQFLKLEQTLDSGQFPADYLVDKHATQQLSQVYAKVHDRVAALGVEWELHDFEATQRAWSDYRDAWLAFIGVAYPQISKNAFMTYLVRERIGQLEAYYATGER